MLSSLLNFFAVAISLKALGVEAFGEVTLLQSYVLVASLCASPQAWQGLIRSLNLESNKASLIKTTLKYEFSCALIGTVAAVLLTDVYLGLLNLAEYAIYLKITCIFIFINQTGVAIGVLRYNEKFSQLALHSIISAVLFFSSTVVGLYYDAGVSYFLISYITSLLVGVLYIQQCCFRDVLLLLKSNSEKGVNNHFDETAYKKFLYGVHLTSLADVPVKQLDNILVGAFVSVGAAGAYRVIKQIATISTKFTGPFNQVLYPEINRLLANNEFKRLKWVMLKIIFALMLFSIAIAALTSATSAYWIPFVFSYELLAYQWHIILFLGVHAISTAFMPIHPVFLALGFIKKLFFITLGSNLALVFVVVLLGPMFGLWGVIGAILIQYAITIACKLPVIFKRLSLEVDESFTLRT